MFAKPMHMCFLRFQFDHISKSPTHVEHIECESVAFYLLFIIHAPQCCHWTQVFIIFYVVCGEADGKVVAPVVGSIIRRTTLTQLLHPLEQDSKKMHHCRVVPT